MAGRGRALRPPLTFSPGPAGLPGPSGPSAGSGETAGRRDDARSAAAGRVETYAGLAGLVRAAPARLGGTRLVAVDGRGAAGKSAFAARLAAALGDVPVVHTDDVVARTGHPWWPALEELVLGPLAAGLPWTDPATGAVRPVPPLLVLEGVSASRRAVTDRLTLAVWLHVPAPARVARGIRRDGPASAADWPRWEAEEERFFAADPAADRADLVADGAPTLPHDPTTEYVRLR